MEHIATHVRELEFTPPIRIFHWLRALSIVILVITGFYISWPFLVAPASTDILIQGWIRFAHIICGFVLTAITVVRAYLFCFSRRNNERRSFKDVFSLHSWIAQIKSYIWMGKLDKAGAYGPLQLMTYAVISLIALLVCVTGLALYANVYHMGVGGMMADSAAWLTWLFGGLAPLRIIHHYLTWAFIIFLVIHMYMAVWSGIRFNHNSVDTIVSGYDYHKVQK